MNNLVLGELKLKTAGFAIVLSIVMAQASFAQDQPSPTEKELNAAVVKQAALLADSERQQIAHNVPPNYCNSDFARRFMIKPVAHYLFIPPENISSIATLGGSGGSGSSFAEPGKKEYKSEMNCPIRVTLEGGAEKFIYFHDRYSTLYGDEVAFSTFPTNPNDPMLKWFDTPGKSH